MRSLRDMMGLSKEAAAPKKPRPTFGPPMPADHTFPESWKVPKTQDKKQELYLWQQWKENDHKPELLDPLLSSLQPVIAKQVRVFNRGVPIPERVLQSVANDRAAEALRAFNPARAGGSALSSWVVTNLKGMNRYVGQNQNMARITEERIQLYGPVRRATEQLRDELGRDPTEMEIAHRINESPDRVSRKRVTARSVRLLGQEKKDDLLASAEMNDPFVSENARMREAMGLVRYDLSPDELQVWEYIRGLNGKPRLHRTVDIAKALKWSQSKVASTKTAIMKKLNPYLEG